MPRIYAGLFFVILLLQIKITHLDYSCFRNQSDSPIPVYIEKKKPVFDLQAKINRCFTGVSGYNDPKFRITYDFNGGDNTKYTAHIDRETWLKITRGCYKVNFSGEISKPVFYHFRKISCN